MNWGSIALELKIWTCDFVVLIKSDKLLEGKQFISNYEKYLRTPPISHEYYFSFIYYLRILFWLLDRVKLLLTSMVRAVDFFKSMPTEKSKM